MLKNTHEMLKIMCKGFCMGAADIIPGVSGGTMAYILGIYERLIAAINGFDLSLLKSAIKLDISTIKQQIDWQFLLPLGGGIIAAILFFTKIIGLGELILLYPTYIYALFFGLIAGSVMVLMAEIKPLCPRDILWLAVGGCLGLMISALTPATTPDAWWFLFISGMFAISAMLLPGVSGAFILLILGKYEFVLHAVANFDFVALLPLFAGMIVGLLIFARIIGWLLAQYHKKVILVINGILLGSLSILYPFQERLYAEIGGKSIQLSSTPILPDLMSADSIIAIAIMIFGIFMVIIMNKFSSS